MPFRVANLRFIALVCCIALIALAGYLVRQRVTDDAITAIHWLDHSQNVRATIFDLNASLSELQASAYALALVPGSEQVQSRYAAAREAYPPILDRLRELTADNAHQQEAIGFLRANLIEKIAELDRSIRGGAATQIQVTRFSIADVSDALLAEEDRLATERQAATERRVRAANAITIATELGQAILMALVVWVAERQNRRRLSAESAQRAAVGRARLIVEAVREPIAVVDADFALLQSNRAFQEFYGVGTDDAGIALDAITGWKDPGLLQRLRDVLVLRRELWDHETAQTDVNDIERRVIVNARMIELPGSDEPVMLLTVSDVTARKHSENQILELNRQLTGKIDQVTEVNQELEAFSYSVSHDLRAPLRHISGFADKLNSQLGASGDPRLLHYCTIIADSARRMSSLIEDLLAYSRLGQHALRLAPVDLQSLVEEVRATLASSIEGRRIEWRIAPLPVVIGDASMLRLAWQNLVENAIKYSASRDPARIEIGFGEQAGEREFWIRDNGVGFDMKYADKLFGVFQRLHKASEFEGTGIGLASVRRIVARHGGHVRAEGEVDQGATIRFTLPIHETNA